MRGASGRAAGELGLEVGDELAPVAEAGQRVAERLAAECVVAEDFGRCALRLGNEFGDQLDLVVLEGARTASEADGALVAAGAVDRVRQRKRPSGGVLDLLRQTGRARRVARGAERDAEVIRRVVGRVSRFAILELQAARVGGERFDRAAQHDVEQGVDVELGRKRVAHAPHRRLQAAALAHGDLQAVLRLLDALATVTGHQQQQPGQRQHEQDRENVALSRDRGEEADRRQTGVDGPHEREDVQWQFRRDAPDARARAAWRTLRRTRSNRRTPP